MSLEEWNGQEDRLEPGVPSLGPDLMDGSTDGRRNNSEQRRGTEGCCLSSSLVSASFLF